MVTAAVFRSHNAEPSYIVEQHTAIGALGPADLGLFATLLLPAPSDDPVAVG